MQECLYRLGAKVYRRRRLEANRFRIPADDAPEGIDVGLAVPPRPIRGLCGHAPSSWRRGEKAPPRSKRALCSHEVENIVMATMQAGVLLTRTGCPWARLIPCPKHGLALTVSVMKRPRCSDITMPEGARLRSERLKDL